MQSRPMPPGNKIPTHYEPGNAPPGRVAKGHAKPPRPGRPAKMQPQGRHTRHPSGPCVLIQIYFTLF